MKINQESFYPAPDR